ncbi:cytochrome P450 [Hygrophoropsis aurantiaca]|uniref:Cytochrome P450 n=1 Tax=Hygrophoropsis aurantiaca TaxID=72124 RepID=A0ACB7ZZV2_9AGAM|nr:cytochrome P450 [Hygrophoropsis aurantiaca]
MLDFDLRQQAFLAAITTLIGVIVVYAPRRQIHPLPPGPPGHWLFGNKLPKSYAPEQFAKWTEEYGPVFSLKQGSQIWIIIGRYQAAMDIMEKEGAALADRPRSISAGEILSGGMRVVVAGAGERLRRLRRALHAQLQPKSAETYEALQTTNAKDMLLDVLNDPKNHQMHAKRYAASTILSITYAHPPTPLTSPLVRSINTCLSHFGAAIRPGAYLVDTYPVLRYVPGYLTQLKAWHEEERTLFEGVLGGVREEVAKGTARPCFAKFLIEHQAEYGLSDRELAYVAGSMFGAGSDTTASAITIMMMAAALHPEAQARVQDELDVVVGRERLPTFDDQAILPQVTAFMLESLRWRPVSIGGFTHRAMRDVVWNGYCIPAGANVIGNHWAIANDPTAFPNPQQFDPLRWLNEEGHIRDDLRFCTYGFGRRVCPGQHVANRSIYISTALILWAFRLHENPAAPIDASLHAFSDTANIHAKPFELQFEERLGGGVLRAVLSGDTSEGSDSSS